MKKVRWRIVWLICSPLIFFVAAVWYWNIFCLPQQVQWQQEQERTQQLTREVCRWKVRYSKLLRQANYLAVENSALNRTFDKLSGLSLQQAINEVNYED